MTKFEEVLIDMASARDATQLPSTREIASLATTAQEQRALWFVFDGIVALMCGRAKAHAMAGEGSNIHKKALHRAEYLTLTGHE